MFYGLASGAVDTGGIEVDQVLSDIETLNRAAFEGKYEVTAVSFHAFAHLLDKYALLPHGASMGDNYGPIVVAKDAGVREVKGRTIAIPGALTTAYLALQLYEKDFQPVVVPFDQIEEFVADGKADAGLLIHEGQLTYRALGLHPVADLGAWWKEETGLPLPLGVNLVRKDLGAARCRQVARILREAIDYSLEHREEALTYAMQFGRGLERGLTDRFVGMYVNDLTREAGSSGRKAIALFLEKGHAAGLLPQRVVPEFVDYGP